MYIRFSRATEVFQFVVRIADRHGVQVYEPGNDVVILPSRLGGGILTGPPEWRVSFAHWIRRVILGRAA
jgi:hypothetical protein